ncbi:hypothetical protein GUJ93_ZPchr0001g31933 [Zizania palustris]|uniref:WRKY domain-containing protein n=1 Tax=Zizania palustris TaxID=103762 RepID=A0A8J5RZE2_ZIZPA|nr:hypothetical protein GUJ93_ZPchr0001g31933 [Zizania palustris]
MQAQSRLVGSAGAGGGAVSFGAPADVHEAVVRELTRGYELTARLQAEAARVLRGQGQAEATAAFILREVSRAFTLCLSIMAGAGAGATPSARAAPATSPRPETPDSAVSVGAPPPPRARDDNVRRKRALTPSPFDDGYQWRKYGQKKINNTNFPRGYYRCSYHRERNCPAQKQVQQHNDEVPPLFAVVYTHEHTCEQPSGSVLLDVATNRASGGDAAAPGYFPPTSSSSLLQRRRLQAGTLADDDDRAAKEERERQALVSSLACVLQGRQYYYDYDGDSRGAASDAPAPVVGSSELPTGIDTGYDGLDVTDYDVTDALFLEPFGTENLAAWYVRSRPPAGAVGRKRERRSKARGLLTTVTSRVARHAPRRSERRHRTTHSPRVCMRRAEFPACRLAAAPQPMARVRPIVLDSGVAREATYTSKRAKHLPAGRPEEPPKATPLTSPSVEPRRRQL